MGNLRIWRNRVSANVFRGVLALAVVCGVTSYAHAQTQPTLSDLLEQANALRLEGKWDEAIDTLREVVNRRVEDEALAATAQIRIGKYLLDAGRMDTAMTELGYAISLFPGQDEAQFWGRLYTIDVLSRQGRQADAWNAAEALLASPNLSPEEAMWTRVKRAEVTIANGEKLAPIILDLKQALNTIEGSTSEPHNWARVRLAELYRRNGNPDASLSQCLAILSDHEDGKATDQQAAWALLWKGRYHEGKQQYAESLTAFQMASTLAAGSDPYTAYLSEVELGDMFRLGTATTEGANPHTEALNHYMKASGLAGTHKLDEQMGDQVRQTICDTLCHLGRCDRGIAWLRMGIEDPAHFRESDKELVHEISRLLPEEQVEQWYLYLKNPTVESDPTSSSVLAEFGTNPPVASTTNVTDPWRRAFWLGQYYRESGQVESALAAFDQANSIAGPGTEKADTLTEIALIQSERKQRVELRNFVKEAASEWKAVIRDTPRQEDAHYALHRLNELYETLGFRDDLFATLEEFLRDMPAETYPSRSLFARYHLMKACLSYDRLQDAIVLGEQGLELHLNTPFPVYHRDLCTKVGGLLMIAYERQGDEAARERVSSTLKARWLMESETGP